MMSTGTSPNIIGFLLFFCFVLLAVARLRVRCLPPHRHRVSFGTGTACPRAVAGTACLELLFPDVSGKVFASGNGLLG